MSPDSHEAYSSTARSGQLDFAPGPQIASVQAALAPRQELSIRAAVPTEGQVRSALDQLSSSKTFATAKRSCQLLRYLVEQVLAGHSATISEYAIALDVFGRSEDFDHRIDTCVRTEAWRLRGRLQHYYGDEGVGDAIRFVFAPRSFVPSFEVQQAAIVVVAQSAPCRIAVSVDCEPGAPEEEERFARRLSEELLGGLFALSSITPLLSEAAGRSDFQLRCAVRSEQEWIRVIATLIDGEHQVRGAKTFSFPRSSSQASPLSVADGARAMVQQSLAGEKWQAGVDVFEQSKGISFLDQLLRGAHANRCQRLAELRKEVIRHERAIADDLLDRLAHLRLIATLGQFLSLVPSATPSVMPRLGASAHTALSLDDSLSDVWLTLGWASNYAHDWKQAQIAARRAIALAPLDPSGYILLSLTHLQQGQIAQAVELAERASALDPFSPMVANAYALTLNAARRFNEASEVALHALAAEPGFVKLRLTLGETKLNMGQVERAIEEFETAHKMMPQDPSACGFLGFACGLIGDIERAMELLAKLKRSPDLRGQPVYAEAIIHMGLGARDEAISVLSEAVRRRGTPGLIFANAIFDPIRSDRRFAKIQRQMELAH